MNTSGVIGGVSVAHGRATVDQIEAAGADTAAETVARLSRAPGVEEAFALSTCNRSEAYVAGEDAAALRTALSGFAPTVPDGAIRRLDHEESIRHLMRVASGLESLVVGEDQIIGQVRDAADEAREAGAMGDRLDDVVTKAIHVGERARTETAINEGTVSLGSAAVELADEAVGVAGETALVVGAGEMGTLVARSLAATAVDEVLVANRTLSTAEHVAAELDASAEALPLSATGRALERAEIVVTATNADDHVLEAADFSHRDVALCIDLAQPRDVAPAAETTVDLRDIDDLEAVTAAARDRRQSEVREVEALIDEEFDRLLDRFKRDRADDAVSAMYEAAERTKRRELDEALTKLEAQGELTDEQRETVASLADALVGQLLAAPTKSLREAAAEDDWNTIHTAMQLFDPEFDEISPEDVPAGPPDGVPADAEMPDDLPFGPDGD
ncbi:glutamyl-tRNA reductase [Halobaculum sp. MBLA0147]|uniref:glutamyl-tRNA reductase n=1 Tax=Halobaculum sp. MBLA0147 TaxID=3079934 RepID=UPI0035252864